MARVRSPAVVEAFANVPREHFAGPGPWRPWYVRDTGPRRMLTRATYATTCWSRSTMRDGGARGARLRYDARHVCGTGITDCVGGRDDAAAGRLVAAIAKSGFASIRSLRRPPDEPGQTCWLAGDGWWLSTASLDV